MATVLEEEEEEEKEEEDKHSDGCSSPKVFLLASIHTHARAYKDSSRNTPWHTHGWGQEKAASYQNLLVYYTSFFSLFFSFFLSLSALGWGSFLWATSFSKGFDPSLTFSLSLSLCLSLHPPFPAQSKFSIPPGLVVPPPLRELSVLKIIYIYDFFTTVKSTTFSLLLSFIWFGLSFLFPVVVVVVFFFGSRAPVGKVVHLGSGVFLQLMTVQAQRGDVDTCNQHL